MEKVGKSTADDDAAYYRQRTVARLIDKRRQIESLEQKEAELRKLEDMKFRVQWKEGFKKKRSEMISTKVDKRILQQILRQYPDMLSQVLSADKFGTTEAYDDVALKDLVHDFDERNIGAENPLDIQSQSALQVTGSKPSTALQFLQNTATFNLSINNRLRAQHAAQTRSQGLARSATTEKCSDMAPLNQRVGMRRSISATDSDLASDERGAEKIAKLHDSKMFSSYRSEVLASKLVMSLLQDPQSAHSPRADQPAPTGEAARSSLGGAPGTGADNKGIVDQLVNRAIKTTGLMLKVYKDSRAPAQSLALERSTSFSLHPTVPAITATPGGRTLVGGVKRTGDAASAASTGGSGGGSGVGSGGSVVSDEQSRAMAGATVAAEPPVSSNAMFCSLVEGVFLLGPSARAIQEQIDLRRNERPDSTGASPSPGQTVPDFNAVVMPTVLYCSERGYSAELMQLLPMYCFPSNVEMGVRSTKTAGPSSTQGGKRRKSSLNILTAKTVADAGADLNKSTKKRNAVFFTSDFTLGLGGKDTSTPAGSKTDTAAVAAAAEPALPPVNAHITHRNPFVLLIGDHTHFEYGVCVQVPVTFKTEAGLVIQTSYVVCMMTKLPFFSYLYHVLDQFDSYFDGLGFKEPIPTQDMSFPFVAALRPLSELAAKLKRVAVPKYPYIISTALNNAPASRRRANTDASVLLSAASPRSPVGGILNNEYPALDNEMDTKAVLPHVEFGYGAITASRKVQATFQRSAYQAYFSTAGMKFDPGNKALVDLIARYDKMVADFVPNSVHRSEKDKEDTYLVMMWALPVLLKHLPLDQIVLALGCAICEMRIIVKHNDLRIVSAVILALLQLLRPLKWCAPVIVTVPDELDTTLESPTFYMVGLQHLPAHFVLQEGFMVIDPAERIVHLNPTDVVESHTILLPHGSKLVNALSPSAETILRCTKKKRVTKMRRSVPNEAELAGGADGSAPAAGASVPSAPLPLPVELDLSSYENLQLLAAIKTFTGLVSNHILAILNTAIQMQHQTKQASREERRLLIRASSKIKEKKVTKKPAPAASAAPSAPAAAVPAPSAPTAPSAPLAVAGAGDIKATDPASTQLTTQQVHLPDGAGTGGAAFTAAAAPAQPQAQESTSPSNKQHGRIAADMKRRRQTDLHPVPHSPGDAHPSRTSAAAAKRSPAGRHSLPAGLKKSPYKPGDGSDTDHRPGDKEKDKGSPPRPTFKPAKAKDFADKLKLDMKHLHAHPPAGRKSVGGPASAPPTVKGSLHGPKGDKRKSLAGTGTFSDSHSPLHTAGSRSTNPNTITPRMEESDQSDAEAVPKPPTDADAAAPAEESQAAVATAEADPGLRGHLSPQPSGRNQAALVFNIDALVSPFVLPSPKVSNKKVTETFTVPLLSNLAPSNAAGDEVQRDSLHDETCSEITVTDAGGMPGVAGADDNSSGNRARTESSSHDSGDRMSETVETVASSASSSLPSLKSNAPLLLVREIGQSGAKFIDRIHETQMYTNYVQQLRQQAAIAAAKRAAAEKALPGEFIPAASVDAGDAMDVMSVVSPNLRAWSHLSLAVEVESAQLAADQLGAKEDTELEMDALHEVFTVMLSGSTPMTKQTTDALAATYKLLYEGKTAPSKEEMRAKCADLESQTAKLQDARTQYATAVSKYAAACARLRHSLDPSTESEPDSEPPAGGLPLWCNGLRCGGMCNTAYCTSICLALWVQRVRGLRQQAAFRSIVSKKHQTKVLLRGGTSPEKSAAGTDHAHRTASLLAPVVEVVRHHKETQSQFEQRKAIVEQRKQEELRRANLDGRNEREPAAGQGKQKSVYGPADGKKRLYARGTADPATLAIARYYAHKQRKIQKSQVRRALLVLKPLMVRFICLYRKFKFFHAIYKIQAIIRGFYVRNHIPELVEALIARRIRRLLAVIRIRRYLRQHADQIYRRYLRAKMEEQRRRRATISIPVKVSVSMSEKVGVRVDQRPKLVRKVYSISDDILPTAGMTIVGLNGETLQPAGRERAGAVTSPTAGLEAVLAAPAAASQGPNESSLAASSDTVDRSAEGANNSVVAGATAMPPASDTSSATTSKAAAKPQRFSTGAYTERVKEFMQFGKILHRNTATAVQPNKYAAHYMQKRNSKPGVSGGPPVPGASAAGPVATAPTSATPAGSSGAVGQDESHINGGIAAAEHDGDTAEGELSSAAQAEEDGQQGEELRARRPRAKAELYISTRFSSSDSGDGSIRSSMRTDSAVFTPHSSVNLEIYAAQERLSSLDTPAEPGTVDLVPPPEVLSPTSGIRILSDKYDDSDDEREQAAREASRLRDGSLTLSDPGSELAAEESASPMSLLEMNVVDISSKSGDDFVSTVDVRSVRSSMARVALHGEEDDRASVLSSNSTGTSPRRRTSHAGSSTDPETVQPVLLSILQHQNVRVHSTSTLGIASESTEHGGDRPGRSSDSDVNGAAAAAQVPDDGTVVSHASQSSAHTNRSAYRSSLPGNLLQDNQMKKLSPIGRYAAERSYNIARIFTPRNSSAGMAANAEGGKAVVSPLQRPANPAHAAQRTPRLHVFGESAKQVRRQTLMGSSGFGRSSFGGEMESISESLSTSEKLAPLKIGGAHDAVKMRTLSERMGAWEMSADGKLGDLQAVDDTGRNYTWGGEAAPARGIRRRNTVHATLPRSPLGGEVGDRGASKTADDAGTYATADPSRLREVGMAHMDDQVPRSEHLTYYLHSKSGSPKTTHKTHSHDSHSHSPARPGSESAQEHKKTESTSMAAPTAALAEFRANTPQPEEPRGRSRTLTVADGEEGEGEDEDDLEFTAIENFEEAAKVAPLRTLGCNVTDLLMRQQMRTLLDMWKLLREGVDILKHSRRGAPKYKTLFCDVNMTKLYWRSQGSKPDHDLDNLPEDFSYYPTLVDSSLPAAALAQGVNPADSAPTSNTTRLPFGGKSNAERVMYIRDILEVHEDCRTEVMQRSVAKGYVTAGRTATISIVWEDRTLDFEIEEESWKTLFHALQILVNFYKVMAVAPRTTFSSSRPPEGFFNFLTYDSTGSSHGQKKRTSSGLGSMLMSRRSSKADMDESANLI